MIQQRRKVIIKKNYLFCQKAGTKLTCSSLSIKREEVAPQGSLCLTKK
jgi:hypothetical protein